MNKCIVIPLVMVCALVYGTYAKAQEMTIEKQLTFACQSHWLDNNDNFPLMAVTFVTTPGKASGLE